MSFYKHFVPNALVHWSCAAIGAIAAGSAAAETITMASTTSTEQSGLFGHLLPEFKKATGIDIKVVAVGTGQALDMARRGDADVLFVHDKAAEEKFIADGWGIQRYPVMYNDFIVTGPASDPAKAAGKDIVEGFKKIAATNAPFVSRGDKSGTYSAELRYWRAAGIDPQSDKNYKACGCGMGPALNIGSSENAYVLTDRATWLSFKNRGDLKVLIEGDPRLFNQYGVMVVNPEKHPKTKVEPAKKFVEWVTSPAGQNVIASYKIDGQQLFFPNADK